MKAQNRSVVTAVEFAELVGVKLATVRRWVRDGRVPAVILPNGSPLFDLAEVKQVLAERQRAAGTVSLCEGGSR